jgi:cytochrome b pre-mRNA-processing protein 3
MKKMAEAFFGRAHAYREAQDRAALEAAIARNIYRGAQTAAAGALADYVVSARTHLVGCDIDSGEIAFGPLPVPKETFAS